MTASDRSIVIRAMYLLSRLLWAITPAHQRRIMRWIPAYRRRDDDLTDLLIEGCKWSASLTNAHATYNAHSSTTTTSPGRVLFTMTTLNQKD